MFNGRISVADYWKSVLLLLAIQLVVTVGGGFLFGALGVSLLKQVSPTLISGMFAGVMGIILLASIPAFIVGIFTLIIGTGLQIRRLHDLNWTGWIVLLFWVLAGIIWIFGRAPSVGSIPQYAPWAGILMGISTLSWLLISLWPGKLDMNAYGAPVSYRSWWAGAVGDKAPIGSGNFIIPTLLGLGVVVLLMIGAGVYFYGNKKVDTLAVVDTGIQQENRVKEDATFAISGNTLSLINSDGEVIQELSLDKQGEFALNLNSEYARSVFNRAFITDADVNFDGRDDVGVLMGTSYAGGDLVYDFYVFNPTNQKLEKSAMLSGLVFTDIDPVKKQIISIYESEQGYVSYIYQWDGSAFTKTSFDPANPTE